MREIDEFSDDESHIERKRTKVKDSEEHSMTTEERDEFIRKYNAEHSIHRITSDEIEKTERSEKSVVYSGESTDRPVQVVRNTPHHHEGFSQSDFEVEPVYAKDECDPTITRLLNNLTVEHNSFSVNLHFPEPFGDFQIHIDEIPQDWKDDQFEENMKDMIRKTLHQRGFLYRKRTGSGGGYYVYNSELNNHGIENALQEEIPKLIETRQSYFTVAKSMLTESRYSLMDTSSDISISNLVVNPMDSISDEAQNEIRETLRQAISETLLENGDLTSVATMSEDEIFNEAKLLESSTYSHLRKIFISEWSIKYPELQKTKLVQTWMQSAPDVFDDAMDTFVRLPKFLPELEGLVDLSFAYLDRQSSGLASWERAAGDSPTSKRDNFILRASNFEVSWLTSIMLSASFIDAYHPDTPRFLSENESQVLDTNNACRIVNRRIGRYLRWKWNHWSDLDTNTDIRGLLEFQPQNKLNVVGAFNKILLESERDRDLFSANNGQSFSEIESNESEVLDFFQRACSGHRTLKKEVLVPLREKRKTLDESITNWWHFSNQKADSYISYSVMKHYQEGYQQFIVLYIPNQGVWIRGQKDGMNWDLLGNMGIGQGKGNRRGEEGQTETWSSFRRTGPVGVPRSWYLSFNNDGISDVKYLALEYNFTKSLFVSPDKKHARLMNKDTNKQKAVDAIFTADRKEDSPTLGEFILISPDSLVTSVLDDLQRIEKGQTPQIWENRVHDMTLAGYPNKIGPIQNQPPSFTDMLSFMQEVLYKQAYGITDAEPTLGCFSEVDLPEKLDVESIISLRQTDLRKYDIARIIKSLQPKLTLEGNYEDIREDVKEISRVQVLLLEQKSNEFLESVPNSSTMNAIDLLTAKTGFLRANNFLFPLRGEIASTIEKYHNKTKTLRTGSKTYQSKLWIKRALEAKKRNDNEHLLEGFDEYKLDRIPKYFECAIIANGFSNYTNGKWEKVSYLEKTKAQESLMLLSIEDSRKRTSHHVLLVNRQQTGAFKGEAGFFICPEIYYDLSGILKYLEDAGVTEASKLSSSLCYWKDRAFDTEEIDEVTMAQIKNNLGNLYERIFTIFSSQPTANLNEFKNPMTSTILEVLKTLTSVSYVTDPRARIVGKKKDLGRPNINRQGFNLEVESSLLGQSSEHFFPYNISVFSAASPSVKSLHEDWMNSSPDSSRLLMGTSYGESTRWPYDIVHFYANNDNMMDALLLESTSATVFRERGFTGTPMIINELLNRKYQALQKGAIKMMHFMIADSATDPKVRENPFGYLNGRIQRVVHDHRIPFEDKPNLSHTLFNNIIEEQMRVIARKLGLLEQTGNYSWIDNISSESRRSVIRIDEKGLELLNDGPLNSRGGTSSRAGLPKLWVPMLSQQWRGISSKVRDMTNSLGGLDEATAFKLWQYFLIIGMEPN